MRRSLVIGFSLLVLPLAASAQVELGLDAGLTLQTGLEFGENVTTISIPTGSARIGFGAGETLSIETLLSFGLVSSDGDSFSILMLMPGVNLQLGEGGAYVRGEVGIQRASGGGDSVSQYAIGGAVGMKRSMGDGVASYRLEAGVDKWLEDEDNFLQGFTQIRLLLGFSVVVG